MKHLLFLSSVILIFSCKEEECHYYNRLTEDEKSWLCMSKANSSYSYSDETGSTFTIPFEGKSHIDFNSVEDCEPTTLVGASIEFGFPGFLNPDIPKVSIEHGEQPQIKIGTTFILGGSMQNNVVIHGNTYHNVYVLSVDSNTVTEPSAWRVYYSREEGILRYDTRNNKFLERN